MENSFRKRNQSLDLLKLISAYMVVFIHVPFHGMFGNIVCVLAKFAVPVFFMSSGFFCRNSDGEKIKRKIRNIVYILLFAIVLYHGMDMILAMILGGKEELIIYI